MPCPACMCIVATHLHQTHSFWTYYKLTEFLIGRTSASDPIRPHTHSSSLLHTHILNHNTDHGLVTLYEVWVGWGTRTRCSSRQVGTRLPTNHAHREPGRQAGSQGGRLSGTVWCASILPVLTCPILNQLKTGSPHHPHAIQARTLKDTVCYTLSMHACMYYVRGCTRLKNGFGSFCALHCRQAFQEESQ